MDNLYYYLALLLVSTFILKYFIHGNKRLPPSPLSVPVIGHLHLIKNPLHQAFERLSSRYGPILYLKFGYRSAVVVSSPSAIEECFTKNDIILSNRPRTMAGDHVTYNYIAYVGAPYGHLWRTLRQLTVTELFSSKSLQKSSIIREEEIRNLLHRLLKISDNGTEKVEFKLWSYFLMFNIMMKLVAGKRCVEDEASDVEVVKEVVEEMKGTFSPSLEMNICDFFPVLRWLGYKGLEKEIVTSHKKRDAFLQGLIEEFRKNKTSSSDSSDILMKEARNMTLMETLLSLRESEPDFYSDDVIKSIILMLFVAGTETSVVTLEWAMSLLLNHPETLKKLRSEIDDHVGHTRLLNDLDLPNLPYLSHVINETLRLYPPAPLSLPRLSSEDCTVGGFEVPQKTILMVNVWAVHRDPKIWEDPTMFKPERFEAMEGEREGFKFIPFGMGRRECPGASMAMRTVSLALGSLVQCFEWEKFGEENLEITRVPGLTLPEHKTLEAVCIPRESLINLLSEHEVRCSM